MIRPRADFHMRTLMRFSPRTAGQLHACLRDVLGLDCPRVALEPGSSSPFDYVAHSFFERGSDAVVWACRGGGKTMLGAAATLLDLLFKPGIEVRVLGGSMDQSRKMYEHLLTLLDQPLIRGRAPGGFSAVLATAPTQRRLLLQNGSRVELLAQSATSVRGTRVHKLRCDEVDEFDPDIWRAAQLVTRGGRCGRFEVRGRVDAMSTMHRPFGLMHGLVGAGGEALTSEGDQAGAVSTGHASPRRAVFKWNAMDVIERCPPKRSCDDCVLWDDCRGRAKQANGFVRIDDLVAQRERSSDAAWEAEVMCRRPSVTDSVYPAFLPSKHVVALSGDALMDPSGAVYAGMDFGVRSPTVWLWAQVIERGGEKHVHVFDEYHVAGGTLDGHLDAIEQQAAQCVYPQPRRVAIDPAGRARNGQTGRSDAELLRARGYRVVARPSAIRAGIERVRRGLDRGTLRIDPRCERLIESMRAYHFDPKRPHDPTPIKDGPDHACDALRYLLVALEGGGRVEVRR